MDFIPFLIKSKTFTFSLKGRTLWLLFAYPNGETTLNLEPLLHKIGSFEPKHCNTVASYLIT